MSTSASRKKTAYLSTLAAALSLVAFSASAQEARSAPWGIYGGANLGIGAYQWDCNTSCDRAAFSGKLFAGKRLTPGLAAEVNYMLFGAVQSANDTAAAAATGINADRMKVRAWTLGINWEVELLHDFTNHLRAGWALVHRSHRLNLADGTSAEVSEHGTAPYLGAGLSFRVNEYVRLKSDFDYIVDGHQSQYLFSVGASTEF